MSAARPAVVAHCDWSLDPRRRAMAVARRDGRGWRLSAPEPVGPPGDLAARLAAGAGPGGVLIGFDFPLGAPRRWGAASGLRDFREGLDRFGAGDWARFWTPAERPEEISVRRPFYPARPGGTSRGHLEAALGATYAELLRRCDRGAGLGRADACMLFWTLGGKQVGKAALSGWRELVIPALGGAALWPFDGPLDRLLATRDVVLAETYPGDAYGQLDIRRTPRWSKRAQEGRRRCGAVLAAHLADPARRLDPEPALAALIEDGFGPAPSGEDPFDAVVGLLAMLEVVEGRRPDGVPHDDADVLRWEGWILGQHAR